MNAATLEREKQDVDNPTGMLHIAYTATPTVALCGAKLKGITHAGAPTDCHVCAEIDRNL